MKLHKDVDPQSDCGGQVASGRELFNTDYWCVYCGAKWSDQSTDDSYNIEVGDRVSIPNPDGEGKSMIEQTLEATVVSVNGAHFQVELDDGTNLGIDWVVDDGVTLIERKPTPPTIVSILIAGRRWFQKLYGNTYHTTEVFVNGEKVGDTPKAYGYGEQYVQSGVELLQSLGYLPTGDLFPYWRRIREDLGITFATTVSDVSRERDL
jgi:hypothetical protein